MESGQPLATGTHEIRCRNCAAALTVADVLGHCSVSWPNQRWLGSQCPRCGASSHVEVASSRRSFGDLDGAPGPAFVPMATHAVPGLRCRPARGGLRITYQRRGVTIPAKP